MGRMEVVAVLSRRLAVVCAVLLFLVRCGDAVGSRGLQNKVIVGYQGWFVAKGDKSDLSKSNPKNEFRQWEIYKEDDDETMRLIPGVDMWPRMDEYNGNKTYPFKGRKLINGQQARVFSSFDYETVDLHFKWMRHYSIDGAFVGRQTRTIDNSVVGKNFRDKVLDNVARACVKYGRVFFINYDISEEDKHNVPYNVDGNVFDRIYDDLEDLFQNKFTPAQKDRYITLGTKRLVRIFGVGSKRNFRDNGAKEIFTAGQAEEKLKMLNAKYAIMLGVNKGWLNLTNNDIREDWRNSAANRAAATKVWKAANYIQPWTVNSFPNFAEADKYYRYGLENDIRWGRQQVPPVRIAPVIWPGFSWRNKKDGVPNNKDSPTLEYNQVPRRLKGQFFWNNGFEALRAQRRANSDTKTLTVAMFDEINEGTAIMKLETRRGFTPKSNSFDLLKKANKNGVRKPWFVINVGGAVEQPDFFLWMTRLLKKCLTSGQITGKVPTYGDNK